MEFECSTLLVICIVGTCLFLTIALNHFGLEVLFFHLLRKESLFNSWEVFKFWVKLSATTTWFLSSTKSFLFIWTFLEELIKDSGAVSQSAIFFELILLNALSRFSALLLTDTRAEYRWVVLLDWALRFNSFSASLLLRSVAFESRINWNQD